MQNSKNWYEVIRQKDYLYIIRERLDKIEPRFHTKYVNLFLILGNKKALLIDTGCGLFPLKPIIDEIIKEKPLLIVNTHSHFDHIGANYEFKEIMIHRNESKNITIPFDLSFMKDSNSDYMKYYKVKNFKLEAAKSVKSLNDGDLIDLGDITLKVYYTPGHSEGSISLVSNTKELFTGDTAHYGSMYLPKRRKFPSFLRSIQKLIDIYDNEKIEEIYPSHEQFPVKKDLLTKLYDGINNIDNIWNKRKRDRFLGSWMVQDNFFKYLI
ncbi:MAG: MBL fold metallo-hydrolase [Promethearchaeota archaeon]